MELKLELKISDRVKLDDLIKQATDAVDPKEILSIFNKMLAIVNSVDRPMKLSLELNQSHQEKFSYRRQANIKHKRSISTSPIEDPTMDIHEFMKITGLARQIIYNRTQRKAANPFPFRIVRISRKLRFPRSKAVYEYLEKGD